MTARTPASNRRFRNALLLGCALGGASLTLADRAQAQAFEGTPGTQAGSVTYNRANPLGAGTETLTINSPGAVILWAPNASGGTQSFLPGGRTARFQGAPGNPNFVVLNRIIPNVPTIYQFDGTVISQISATNATRGGTVLFYTPGGIIVGPTALFDVGSLVLTTLDVGFDATGNIFQPDGSIQFRSGRGGAGGVQTLAGSQINANSEGSNLLLVAPAINHAGAIRVNGSAAFIAAQSVDVRFNAGLFDIVVQANGGTTAGGTVITHSGSTTGPASTGAGDNHRIYMVGVAETNAISMLLNGTMGFDASLNAAVENGQIVLSSGYNVGNGNVVEVIDNGAPGSTVVSTGGSFTSDVIARARSGIAFAAFATDLNFAGDLDALSRGQIVGLLAANGFDATVGGNLILATTQLARSAANPDSIGGTAVIQAGPGSTVSIAGNALLDSSAIGFGLLDGSFVGRGGTVRVTGNGAVNIAGNLTMNALGQGRDGGYGGTSLINGAGTVSVAGNLSSAVIGAAPINNAGINGGVGQGGTITLTTSGSITIGGEATLFATGIGGNVAAAISSTGGDGTGGTISLNVDGGAIDIGGLLSMNAAGIGGAAQLGGTGLGGVMQANADGGRIRIGGSVDANADGQGGTSTTGDGGDGTGGSFALSTTNGGTLTGGATNASLRGLGGGGIAGGDGRGGNANLTAQIGAASIQLAGLTANVGGQGGSGTGAGGGGTGGGIQLTAADSGIVNLGGTIDLSAAGIGGDGAIGGNGTGGEILASASNGEITLGTSLTATADGEGGDGTAGDGGDGTGGSVTLRALSDVAAGRLNAGAVTTYARGFGGAGSNGGDGFGGGIDITARVGNAVLAFGATSANASGQGGSGTTTGGDGFGGTVTAGIGSEALPQGTGGGASFGTLTLTANGDGGTGPGATGGDGTGGTILLAANGRPVTFTSASLAANGNGAAGGGLGTGGLLTIRATGPGSLIGTSLIGSANGAGPLANGNGAGRWEVEANGGLIRLATLRLEALAGGGGALPTSTLSVTDGALDITSSATLTSSGDITAQASGSGQYQGLGSYALNARNISVTHAGPPPGARTFDVGGFSATTNGTFTADAASLIRATGTLNVNALGAVNVAGGLLGGAIVVRGSTVTVALADGVSLDLGATTSLNVTQAHASGNIVFLAGGAASFGSATAGGSFSGSGATLNLPNLTAALINVAATNGAANLGILTGSSGLTVTATDNIGFTQLNGGAIALTSSGGAISGGNASGASAAFNAATTLNIASATASGNIQFLAGNTATFGAVTAGGSFTGSGTSLNLSQATAAIVNVNATNGIATLGTLTGTSSLAVLATGNIGFNQLNGGAIALTSSGGGISGTNVSGASAVFNAAGAINVASAAASGNIQFLAGNTATFGAVTAGGSFTGSGTSLNLPNVNAGLINVAATNGAASLGALTGSNGLTVTASGNINFNQLNGGAIGLTSSGGSLFGTTASGSSGAFNAVGAINIANAAASGNIQFQAGGAATFGSATAGGSFSGNAASLNLSQATAGLINVNATNGAASLGTLTGTNGLTVLATGNIGFNQLNGGAIVLTSSGGAISGSNVSGASGAFNAAGALSVTNTAVSGNIQFQSGGATTFGTATAGGSFAGTAPSLSFAQITAAIVNVGATAGPASLGIMTGTTALTATATGDIGFTRLTGGAITLTSSGGNISGADASGTTLLFDAAQLASFSGLIGGNDIRVVSRDIDLGTNARLGNASTQLVSLTARQSGLQTVIGGTTQGPGYTLTNAEAGRIRTVQLAIQASANGTAANRAPDAVLRDLNLSATPTSSGGAVNRLVVTLGGNAPAILEVNGAVSLANAGATDGITLTAPGRLQIVTPSGSVRVRNAAGGPGGRVQFASANIWSASQSLINQLIADPNFTGRNAALLANSGPFEPRGYIEAADVILQVGSTAFVQNSGTVPVNFGDGNAYAGITVSRSTLTVTPTGTQPIQVYAFGRSIGADGSSSVNNDFFREVAFGRPNGQTTSYTDASELNQCVINTGVCPLRIPVDFNEPEGPEIVEGPVDGSDAILNPQPPNSDVIDTSFASEELIEEPVTSGAEASAWDCDDPDDERCRRQPRSER